MVCGYIPYLKIKDIHNYNKNGIIIIDNFETLAQEDKERFIEFIRYESPRSIQYILTSRNEVNCEDRLYISEFSESDGRIFVKKYIEENDLNILLSDEDIRTLINVSKGNTLVLVLSLHRLNSDKVTLENIADELNAQKLLFTKLRTELQNIATHNMEKIADFMYKNTFEQTYDLLKSQNIDIDKIMKTLCLYGEPIDLFTLSIISGVPLSTVEKVCSLLSRKLILEKKGELFTINDFANKYIIIKFIPDAFEHKNLKQQIENKKMRLIKIWKI